MAWQGQLLHRPSQKLRVGASSQDIPVPPTEKSPELPRGVSSSSAKTLQPNASGTADVVMTEVQGEAHEVWETDRSQRARTMAGLAICSSDPDHHVTMSKDVVTSCRSWCRATHLPLSMQRIQQLALRPTERNTIRKRNVLNDVTQNFDAMGGKLQRGLGRRLEGRRGAESLSTNDLM